ncbi:unnamed protein product, partial [Ectocarpus sp. 13 AM-2016]
LKQLEQLLEEKLLLLKKPAAAAVSLSECQPLGVLRRQSSHEEIMRGHPQAAR